MLFVRKRKGITEDRITYKNINRIPLRNIPIMVLAYFSINILGLALPLAMKRIYGTVITDKAIVTLRVLLIGTLVALLLEAFLRKIKDSSSRWIASVYEYKLSNFLIEKIMTSHEQNEKNGYISNLEKMNSVSIVTGFSAASIYQLIIDLPFSVLYLLLIYLFGKGLVLVPIGLIAVYVLIMSVNTHFLTEYRRSEIKETDKMLSLLTESLEKIHMVKASGMESQKIKLYKERLKTVTIMNYLTNKYDNASKAINGNFGQMTLFSILIGGGYLMQQGLMTFGEVTACAMLGSRAMTPIVHVMNSFQQSREMRILKERLEEIVDRPRQYDYNIPAFPEDIEGTIELIKLKYSNIQNGQNYEISSIVPKNSLVVINPRESISYKMILNKLRGLETLEGGKILIDNMDITKWNMNTLRGKLEYLDTSVQLIKGSILDNLVYFDYSKAQNAYIASGLTGLDELVSQMPEGYETEIDSYSTNQLSTAFLQRLNLTRVLVSRPRILILDRLDEGMDSETKAHFLWLIEHLKGAMTLIVVSEMSDIRSLANCEIKNL